MLLVKWRVISETGLDLRESSLMSNDEMETARLKARQMDANGIDAHIYLCLDNVVKYESWSLALDSIDSILLPEELTPSEFFWADRSVSTDLLSVIRELNSDYDDMLEEFRRQD